MALSPDEKKIYINADTTAGEADGAMYFPVKYLTGLESTSNITATMYFRGPNNTTSTSVIVLITADFIKEFYTQFVNEINFGDKAVITLAVRNLSVSTTQGGSDFVYVNAFAGAIVVNDDTAGYEDLQIAEDLDVGGTITGDLTGDVTGTASIATTVTVADESTDTTCFPLFSTAATGDLAPKSGSNLTFNSSSGLLTATLLAGDLTGDVTGNADTATLAADATTLATPRAIFGHNFDGSAALTGVIASANLDADTAHLTTTQTFSGDKTFSANTALAGVIMDGNTITGVDDSGEFTDDDAHIMTSAGINDRFAQINADTTGNADTATLAADATTLATPRAINGVDFDGSAAITVTAAGSTLSDTVTVAKGGTGLTTVSSNSILTGNGTSALTVEANLQFASNRITIGNNEDITPMIRFYNDENVVNVGTSSLNNNLVSGDVDGDFVINSTGDHNILFGQNNAIALTIDTNGDSNFNRRFTVTGDTDGTYEGDVVYFGGTTSMTVGTIYHYKSDGTWEVANANAVATSDGLLGVALGAASDTNGMLLRGMVTLDHDPGAVGDVLYLSNTSGDASATAPSDNNDIVRVIGYCLHASNGQIWFNPDSTFVEVTA